MQSVYYLPSGPKNLNGIFPAIDFGQLDQYFIEVLDTSDTVAVTTPTFQLKDYCEDNVRVHFVNYLGAVDAVNFLRLTQQHDVKSGEKQTPLGYPLIKSKHSASRFNVRSNDMFTCVCGEYYEDKLAWLDELLDSPMAWMEWSGKQGQMDSYLPIVISDAKSVKVQEEDRFRYDITISFKLSNERIIIRG